MSKAVNLARVRVALANLDALLISGAIDPTRTARWLDSTLKEGEMKTDDLLPTSIRLPRSLFERIDDLIPTVQDQPDAMALAGTRGITRSTVLRLAIERGLSAMEATEGEQAVTLQEIKTHLETIRADLSILVNQG